MSKKREAVQDEAGALSYQENRAMWGVMPVYMVHVLP